MIPGSRPDCRMPRPSFFLPEIVGWGKVAEMYLTGERLPAADTLRMG